MSNRILYTLWLQSCIGYASPYVMQIINTFETSEQIYFAGEKELRISGLFTRGQLRRLLNKDLDKAKRIYDRAVQDGARIVTISSNEYPASLRRIPDPPLLFFIKGQMPSHHGLKVAVVGTREPTRLGERISHDLSYELARNKALIVSGGAEGIDIQAHKGALEAGGRTVCVLGNGISYRYLMKYADIREEIIRSGAVISEYPMDAASSAFTFPQRNRIIVGIADCALVVEGGLDSGSLVSASKAAEQHKMVFAVPGSLDNKKALGTNYLLTKGARAVVRAQDVTEWYDTRRTADDITPPVLNSRVIDSARSITKQRIAEAEKYAAIIHEDNAPDSRDYDELKSSPVSAREKIKIDTEQPDIGTTPSDKAPEDTGAVTPVIPQEQETSQTVTEPVSEEPSAKAYDVQKTGSQDNDRPPADEYSYKVSRSHSAIVRTVTMRSPIKRSDGVPDENSTVNLHEKSFDTSSDIEKTDSDILSVLTKEGYSVYHTISETPKSAEDIGQTLQMGANDVLTALSELEMYGLAEVNGFGLYSKK